MRIYGGRRSSWAHFCDFTERKNQKYGTHQQGHSSDSNLATHFSTSCRLKLQFLFHVSNITQAAKNTFGKMGNKELGYSYMLKLNYIFGNIFNRTGIFGQDFAMMT